MKKSEFKEYADLLIKAQNGDDEAFREIYRRTKAAQLYHLKNIMGNSDDVMDALQEVYILLYQNLKKINPPTVLIAYLNRLSYHVGQNMQRKEGRRNRTFITMDWLENVEGEEQPNMQNSVENDEKIQMVRDAISQLPEQEQSVIFMRYYQKLKQKEVAMSLGVSLDKAKNLQRAAHKKLGRILKSRGVSTWGVLLPGVFIPDGSGTGSAGAGTASAAGPASLLSVTAAGAAGTGAAVLGVTAVLMYGVSSMGHTTIHSAEVFADPAAGKARIQITADSTTPVRRVTLTQNASQSTSESSASDRNTERVSFGQRTGSGEYLLLAKQNGSYTITVETNGGSKASREIQVTGLDEEMPEVIGIRSENGTLIIQFADDLSGVDYSNLFCESDSGKTLRPIKINEKKNEAVFELTQENQKLHFSDKAGNAGQIPLYHKNKNGPKAAPSNIS